LAAAEPGASLASRLAGRREGLRDVVAFRRALHGID
jgi:hypothetical protein